MNDFRSVYPFASHFCETKAGKLHYLDEGPKDAPVLLMLHGNPTWSFYFRSLIVAFRSTHRVIAPDHLGCGLSDKPQNWSYRLQDHISNVIHLMESLQIQRCTLVVHDWGGAIGMGVALARPEWCQKLVVFNTAAYLAPRIPFSIDLCRVPVFGAIAIRGLNAFAQVALMRCVEHRERLTPAVRDGYLHPYDSWAHRVAHLRFVEDIPMSSNHPSWGTLAAIGDGLASLRDRPMLILWGAKDFCFDTWFYEEWRRRFPDAQAHLFEDAGHYVVEDAHERIVPLMKEFI